MRKVQAIKIRPNYKQALAELAVRPEFSVFKKLMEIEENNIIVKSFKIPATDPELKVKKAQLEGKLAELRIFKKTFEDAVRGFKDE